MEGLMDKNKVLIVDDDNRSIESIKMLLDMDYDVHTASGVKEACGKIQANNYSVVISDYYMNDGTAINLLDKYSHKIPIIVMTGRGDKELVVELLNHKAKFLAEKPVDPDLLEEKVKEIIGEQKEFLDSKKMAFFGEGCAKLVHDLANAVTVVTGWVKTLELAVEKYEDPQLKKMTESLIKTSERIVSIIKSSKEILNSTQNYAELESVSLSSFFEQLGFESEAKLEQAGIKISIDTPPEVFIKVNEYELYRIFDNFISNSMDSLKEAAVKEIKISTMLEGDRVKIKFTDSGSGIPQENRSKVFQKSFTTKGGGDGAGLGLYICQEIIRGFNGSLTLAEGTTAAEFLVTLPATVEVKKAS